MSGNLRIAWVGGAHTFIGDRIVSVELTKIAGYDTDHQWRNVGTVSLNVYTRLPGGKAYHVDLVETYPDLDAFNAALDNGVVPGITSAFDGWNERSWHPQKAVRQALN